jgi:DEAD/DEAH box helicase domain-containing protein
MLFLDIETQNTMDFGRSFKISDLLISYVGVIDEEGNEYDFWEKDIDKLVALLKDADWIVGYNSISFDLPVIANYVGDWINNLPQMDLMVAVYKRIGFRPKLDNLTQATLGYGKNGVGSDAPLLYQKGELQKLRDYCMQDVRITKDLYDFGIKNGFVKYWDKSGFTKQTDVDWNLGKKFSEVPDDNVNTLF